MTGDNWVQIAEIVGAVVAIVAVAYFFFRD